MNEVVENVSSRTPDRLISNSLTPVNIGISLTSESLTNSVFEDSRYVKPIGSGLGGTNCEVSMVCTSVDGPSSAICVVAANVDMASRVSTTVACSVGCTCSGSTRVNSTIPPAAPSPLVAVLSAM